MRSKCPDCGVYAELHICSAHAPRWPNTGEQMAAFTQRTTSPRTESSPTLRHAADCRARFATMDFDSACARCKWIDRVVHLRRKLVSLGASQDEEDSALALADALIAKYKLTRGEVFDRLFAAPAVVAQAAPTREEFNEPTVRRAQHKMSSTGGNGHAYGYRSRARKDMSW